ncbi:hypothetical protein MBANPS3_007686, partial [Mucor bainieri]
VDLRISHEQIRQRYNTETDIGVFEAAEEEPEIEKYTTDRYKELVEIKSVIDRFVSDGFLIDSVDSLQVCGFENHFGYTTLAKPGLYAGNHQ